MIEPLREPRPTCARCLRPSSVCYCAHLPHLTTTTRVVVLQHPREEGMAIGTARMASLCLPNASLHVGVSFENDADVRAAIRDPARPAALLYPGPGAIDIATSPPTGPVTLVVVDGTWALAKKLVRMNPSVAALPRYSFKPTSPSGYRIRREPHDDYVSTIEAMAHTLGLLEGDSVRFAAMLQPFRAMIDAQIACRDTLRASRHKHSPRTPRRPALPAEFRDRLDDLVCVVAEANAWPYRTKDAPPDELVHFLATRPVTGERFEAIVAPRVALAPSTASHTQLDEATIRGGMSVAEFLDRWARFARGADILCAWGHYHPMLLAKTGAQLPSGRIDLRRAAAALTKAKAGAIESFIVGVPGERSSPLGAGRGGERLALVSDVTRYFAEIASR